MPQNRAKTGADGRFRPGTTGNAGGRPKGLMQYVRAKTNDGRTIADFMLSVMADTNRKLDQRMEAATWLADRGFGKPSQVIEHGGDPDTPVTIGLTWGEVGDDQQARHGHGH